MNEPGQADMPAGISTWDDAISQRFARNLKQGQMKAAAKLLAAYPSLRDHPPSADTGWYLHTIMTVSDAINNGVLSFLVDNNFSFERDQQSKRALDTLAFAVSLSGPPPLVGWLDHVGLLTPQDTTARMGVLAQEAGKVRKANQAEIEQLLGGKAGRDRVAVFREQVPSWLGRNAFEWTHMVATAKEFEVVIEAIEATNQKLGGTSKKLPDDDRFPLGRSALELLKSGLQHPHWATPHSMTVLLAACTNSFGEPRASATVCRLWEHREEVDALMAHLPNLKTPAARAWLSLGLHSLWGSMLPGGPQGEAWMAVQEGCHRVVAPLLDRMGERRVCKTIVRGRWASFLNEAERAILEQHKLDRTTPAGAPTVRRARM